MTCWYCGKKLGKVYWEVPNLLGHYCKECAEMLCDEGDEPIKVKDDE